MPRARARKKRGASVGVLAARTQHAAVRVHSSALFPCAKRDGAHIEQQLSLRELHRRIWAIDAFLTPAECEAWVTHAERVGFGEVEHAATFDSAYRHNGRIELVDSDVASRIWERLRAFIPADCHRGRAVGCFDKIRLYRYQPGQRFGKHIDESNTLGASRRTGITVLIYLNDDGLKGGETVFYKDHAGTTPVVRFSPARGSLLFHGHGAQCLTHEAMEVVQGAKYVLRTDVVFEV